MKLPSWFSNVLVSATWTGALLLLAMVTVAVPSALTTTFGGAAVQAPPVHCTPGGRFVGVTSLSMTLVPTGKDSGGTGAAT